MNDYEKALKLLGEEKRPKQKKSSGRLKKKTVMVVAVICGFLLVIPVIQYVQRGFEETNILVKEIEEAVELSSNSSISWGLFVEKEEFPNGWYRFKVEIVFDDEPWENYEADLYFNEISKSYRIVPVSS